MAPSWRELYARWTAWCGTTIGSRSPAADAIERIASRTRDVMETSWRSSIGDRVVRSREELAAIENRSRAMRAVWSLVWLVFYRPSPRPLHAWRRVLLRAFGAKVARRAHPYPSSRVWAPWNLEMGAGSCLGEHVDCYCVEKVRIGAGVTVSQYSYLCTASHDYTYSDMPLTAAPIIIGDQAWVTADVFIGPGVTIGEGAVVTARSSVFHDVEPWTVVSGNPAKPVRKRVLRD